jgi:hypothetical protein
MTEKHRAKMASLKDAPAGIETDGQGNIIPFEKRTKDDREKVMDAIAGKLHGENDVAADQPANTTPK